MPQNPNNDDASGQKPRIPPNQVVTKKFPVMTAGKTPQIDCDKWRLDIKHGPKILKSWSWQGFNNLPKVTWEGDIHCVTRWSKLNTKWRGVLVDTLLTDAGVAPPSKHVLANSYEGYSTNIPFADLTDGKAMVATEFDGKPLQREHGGPARLLVPHLYFWKSAKWLKSIQFTEKDEAGFWELRGYHAYGDPWHEQRFSE